MGLDRRKIPTVVMPVTMVINTTFSHVIPEKLPFDQLCKFTILASSAKVTTKSVIAEQIYPIITPLTISMDILSITLDIRITNPIQIIAPTNAARIITQELTLQV